MAGNLECSENFQLSAVDSIDLFPTISRPLASLEELMQWTPGTSKVISLFTSPRGRDPLNVSSVALRTRDVTSIDRLVLHCHDMKGGYLETDKYPQVREIWVKSHGSVVWRFPFFHGCIQLQALVPFGHICVL